MPQAAGKSAQIIVQNPLFVSLYMVMREVEQGQCIRENKRTHMAVVQFQPWSRRSSFSCTMFSKLLMVPWAV